MANQASKNRCLAAITQGKLSWVVRGEAAYLVFTRDGQNYGFAATPETLQGVLRLVTCCATHNGLNLTLEDAAKITQQLRRVVLCVAEPTNPKPPLDSQPAVRIRKRDRICKIAFRLFLLVMTAKVIHAFWVIARMVITRVFS